MTIGLLDIQKNVIRSCILEKLEPIDLLRFAQVSKKCLSLAQQQFKNRKIEYSYENLNLMEFSIKTEKSLFHLLLVCPKLKKLNLTFCNCLTQNGVEKVTQLLPELQELNISLCQPYEIEKLQDILNSSSTLKKIIYWTRDKVSDFPVDYTVSKA